MAGVIALFFLATPIWLLLTILLLNRRFGWAIVATLLLAGLAASLLAVALGPTRDPKPTNR